MPLIRKPSYPGSAADAPSPGMLRDGTPDERWTAARAMTATADAPELARALAAETDPRVRGALLASLARIGAPEGLQAVIASIRSDDASLRTAAIDALLSAPASAAAALPGLLADTDPDVRLLACELARALPGPGPAGLMCELLDREAEPNVCAAAIEVLAEVGVPEALPALRRCAVRFADQPFLGFAIGVAIERIGGDGLG